MASAVRGCWVSRRMIVLAVAIGAASGTGIAHASCAAPDFSVPQSVTAGDDLVVSGEYFAAECNDTGMSCLGSRRSPPMQDIIVELQDDAGIVARVIVDANDDFEFSAVLPVPADAEPGQYHVVVDDDDLAPGMVGTDEVTVRAP